MAAQNQISRVPDQKNARPKVWLFLVLSFLGLLLINAIWLFPTLRDVEENTSRLRLEIAERTRDSVSNFMERKIEALKNTASAVRFEKRKSQELLERLLKENPEFNSVSILDQSLKEVFKISRFQVVRREDLADYSSAEEFHRALEGEIYQGPVLRNQILEPFILVVAPLIFGEKEKAVLLGELNLKFLSGLVNKFKFGQTGRVYLIDNAAKIIIHPDVSLVLKGLNLKHSAGALEVLQGATLPAFRHLNEQGVEVEASGLFLSDFNWGVISEQNFSEINILRNRIVIVATFSFSIGALLLLFLFQNRSKLIQVNQRLTQILYENYFSAKLLLQRDQDLTFVNEELTRLNKELDDVGKVLVRRELELTEANASLRELDTAKSEFVSVAAHQLRTPLTGIRWSYQELLEGGAGKLTKIQRKIIEDALQAAIRMTNLINDLLNVARIEGGRLGFSMQTLPWGPLIKKEIPRFIKRAGEKGIKVVVDIAESLPASNFDPAKTLVVLEDLLDNAIKYTSPGGKILVRFFQEEKLVRVEVEDNGIGIPKEQQRLVFSKFFRADNALLFQTVGTGLGLFLVKNIIEKQGGEIGFKSEENKGSTFWFTLPVAK